MYSDDDSMPPVFPVSDDTPPVRRRAVFSHNYQMIMSRHAQSPDEVPHRPHRTKTDSLQLIEDLINQPVDRLYQDARLVRKPDSKLVYYTTRIIVCVICIAVGFFGCQFVRLLNTDPRKEVRESLASQLEANNDQLQTLETDIKDLRKSIEEQSSTTQLTETEKIVRQNDAAAGATDVEGEGIVFTLSNPLAAETSTTGSSETGKIRVVLDNDLRLLVSRLWQCGAEAIAINGVRLGVQTAIRKAGNSIMVGTTPVESPYHIQAIGDANQLAQDMSKQALPQLYAVYEKAGMQPTVSKEKELKLDAATSGQVSYARRIE